MISIADDFDDSIPRDQVVRRVRFGNSERVTINLIDKGACHVYHSKTKLLFTDGRISKC